MVKLLSNFCSNKLYNLCLTSQRTISLSTKVVWTKMNFAIEMFPNTRKIKKLMNISHRKQAQKARVQNTNTKQSHVNSSPWTHPLKRMKNKRINWKWKDERNKKWNESFKVFGNLEWIIMTLTPVSMALKSPRCIMAVCNPPTDNTIQNMKGIQAIINWNY